MKGFIPHFIGKRFQENSLRGSLIGTSLFMDISGFTPMTSTLMEKGKEGAEVLSDILNEIFTPVVEALYVRGGFISVFAGDALTGLFFADQGLSEDLVNPLLAALEIRNIFIQQGVQETGYGDFSLSVKLGLSYGTVSWRILGEGNHYRYFFSGEAIDGAAVSEQQSGKMEIILDERVYLRVKEIADTTVQGEGYYLLNNLLIEDQPKKTPILQKGTGKIDLHILRNFLPKELVDCQPVGEFRNVVSVFISFKIPTDSLDSLIGFVMDQTKVFGGWINKIDFGDKGGTMLVFFGAPISYENDMERAINFILHLREVFAHRVRAGMTSGIVYFGPIGSERRAEYTCIGDVVNLAARFMMEASFNKVWVSTEIQEKTQDRFNYQDLGRQSFKGKEEPIRVFSLKGKKDTSKERYFSSEMIGREGELQLIKRHCQETILQGRFGGVFYLYGEAGVGKSRLVVEALAGLPVRVCTLQTDSILKQSLNPFTSFLKGYFHQNPGIPILERKVLFEERLEILLGELKGLSSRPPLREIQEIERTLSLLGAMVGLYWEGSLYERLDAKGRQENTYFALKNFFKVLSRIQPLVLLLEDLHWIDPDSMDLFALIARNIGDYPIIILATSRMNDDGTKPQLAIKEVLEKELLLERLPDDEIVLFIIDQLGHQVTEELMAEIKGKSLGNPFYMEQFCLYLKEKNFIELQEGYFILKKAPESLPVEIHSILISRIDRLSQEVKTLIQVASVLGREVDLNILFSLIQSLQEILREDFKKSVEKAEQEQLWSALHELKYIFKHALLREAVYEMQLRKTLQLLHGLAAESMERIYSQGGEDASEIAFHYDKAKQVEKAIYFYRKASEQAKNDYHNKEALMYYQRLLELVTHGKEMIEILNQQGMVYQLVGEWDEAKKIFQRSIAMAQEMGDAELLAKGKSLFGQLLLNKGEYSEALELLNHVKELATSFKNNQLYGETLRHLGNLYLHQGNYGEAREIYEECNKIFLQLGDKSNYAKTSGNMGILFHMQGDYGKALEYYRENAIVAEEIGDKRSYSAAVGNSGSLYKAQGNYAKAMENYEEQKQTSLELGDKFWYSMAIGNIGTLHWYKGDYHQAMECYRESLNILKELGEKSSYAIVLGNIGLIYRCKGEYDKSLEYSKEYLFLSKDLGDQRNIAAACFQLGNTYSEMGEYKKSITYFNEAIEGGRSLGVNYSLCEYLHNKGRALLEVGEEDQAKILNDEAIEMAQQIGRSEILFDATLFNHRIEGDTQSLLRILDQENLKEEERAAVHFELSRLTKSTNYTQQAIQLYQILYEKTPKFTYKKRLDFLGNQP